MGYTLDSTQHTILLALVGLWAVLLFGGFALGKEWDDRTRRMPVWTRMASSLTLVVTAWMLFIFTLNQPITPYALLIAIGMSLGFIGDLFMAGLIKLGDRVLGGIGAFGIGHAAYIAALLGYGGQFGFDDPSSRWGAWIFWLILGAVIWYVVVYRGAEHTTLHYASLPYALLLASTAGFATGLALQTSAFIPVAIGAALFLSSDLLIAATLFNGLHFRLVDDVIWLTYGPAQMLIVCGVALMRLVT